MIRLGVPEVVLGPSGISKQEMRVEQLDNRASSSSNKKLYQLMKDERYTDVALKFDDGKTMSCHR